MRHPVLLATLVFACCCLPARDGFAENADTVVMYAENDDGLFLTDEGASHFANLALACVHQEYPNKLNQSLPGPERLLPPSELHPAFYGCYDWHSSVHGHWMLVKLLKEFPELGESGRIREVLRESLSRPNLATELEYFDGESGSWERTYGWAWLLQLAMELETWADPLGAELAENLAPLSNYMRRRFEDFLPRQEYAIRTGVHPNTAFGLSFALDYARATGNKDFEAMLMSAALRYYMNDENCPLSWEPSGEDFLSPCFEEAALMARVLPGDAYRSWLRRFLPQLFAAGELSPVNVSDRSDGKIGHLDGLNLSRAWNLYVIAGAIDRDDTASRLRGWAARHLVATLPHVASEYYEGTHWLGSFAVYALTRNR